MVQTAASKNERINLRLDTTAKHKLERAASLEGKTVSGFVLSNALACAERTIHEHELMLLGRRDADAFFDAILTPRKPNDKLAAALKEYAERVASR